MKYIYNILHNHFSIKNLYLLYFKKKNIQIQPIKHLMQNRLKEKILQISSTFC